MHRWPNAVRPLRRVTCAPSLDAPRARPATAHRENMPLPEAYRRNSFLIIGTVLFVGGITGLVVAYTWCVAPSRARARPDQRSAREPRNTR